LAKNVGQKIENLIKNRNFCQKIEIFTENENFRKNRNVDEKIGRKIRILNKNRIKFFFWHFRIFEIEILVKNRNFGKNRNYGEKLKFCSEMEILIKNRNFDQKSKLKKIEILVKNGKSKFW